ncbi:ion channel TACAN-like isoform X1 [Stegodyphus dumicola]|uniref:ion channel TACAN-like isoform X1 n=1 Tax=Stegodyphus dumicola TaxID=202533 RepID=UPI0015AA54C4|nr:ion channel TACAN-like isoform X1 [Stegodyphus dumicola]XP_035212931.1 ion channel TACAN-like isoform X1 [Stegodyphus dumicola]
MEEKVDGLSSIVEEWNELNKTFPELENMQKSCSKTVSAFKKAEAEFRKAITHHMKGITRISEALKCIRPSSEKERNDVKDLKKSIAVRNEDLRSMLSTLPKESGLYLKIVLGNVNVTLLNEEEKYKYKDEYERFKLVVTIIVLILSFLNILTTYRTLDALLHFLLVWYYCTLTIRESILVVNGSRIKGWWRLHHFITTVLAGVLILWHDGPSYQLFRRQFMLYSCYSSFLQFLQYNYQQGCLYRLRALGERYNMDITVDGFHSWMWRGLKFLLPFLIIGYCWQLFNAYTLYKISLELGRAEWQVSASALMFFILFLGNSSTTAIVVHQKLNLKDLILRKLQ